MIDHLRTLITALGPILSHYGIWGLFAISFLDSSFLAFPVINDLVLIKIASLSPHDAFFGAMMSTVGSVLGAYALYAITRRGKRLLAAKEGTETQKTQIRRWIERNDFVSILVGSLLPPPTPFKLFPIIAGGLHVDVSRFLLALIVGRGIRFGAEAWLGAKYGPAAASYLKGTIGWMSLVAVVAIVAATLIYRWVGKRRESSV
ncbi:MAG: YqaA family protein [Terriglobia bacterium]